MREGEWIWQGRREIISSSWHILARAKYEMFIRYQGRDTLLVAGNVDVELGEVWPKSRDNGS